MSIVQFPPKEDPMVWVCECGCATFQLLSTSEIRCASCEKVSNTEGNWAVDHDAEVTDAQPFRCISVGSVDFARERTLRKAADPGSLLIASISSQGRLTTWVGLPDDADEGQKDWFRRNINDLTELCLRALED
jgi:hypothetical protein